MKVLVVGTGYVGLVTGACLARLGHDVLCLDCNVEKIVQLKAGVIPIYEPGLEELVKSGIAKGNLRFTTDYAEGVAHGDICFIAVSTPSLEDGSANIAYVNEAALSIAAHMKGFKIIVTKSTIPVGTTHGLGTLFKEKGCDVAMVFNPEFLKEGSAIQDFMQPDRIVIGAEMPLAAQTLSELYAPLNLPAEKVLWMDILSAEMTKYAANAMLATRISFINEMANLCEKLGADITKVRQGIGSDPRIGPAFLQAGCGYGGSCFPKDVKALRAMGKGAQVPTPLLDATELVNEKQKKTLSEKICSYFADKGGVFGKKIALWGLAFKPGTDDMREAPSLTLIRALLTEGAHLRLYDPIAMEQAKKILPATPQITFANSPLECAQGADAIALLTEWGEFKTMDLAQTLSHMAGSAFFDGRNQYEPATMQSLGWEYFYVGGARSSSLICKDI